MYVYSNDLCTYCEYMFDIGHSPGPLLTQPTPLKTREKIYENWLDSTG